MLNYIAKNRIKLVFYLLCILLALPALLINLGLLALIDDEGIRALVALEMKISGNYITPTMLGEYYYNKPPLYNWILLIFFNLTGVISEFTIRFPTVIFLLSYAATVFYYFKKHFSIELAFLTAFSLITCGRIFFYDSMLGLIDTAFSWVIFLLFMVVYHEFKKGNFLRLFLISYLLASIAFLMKGLPAVVFQAFTLSGYFIFKKSFKKLFAWQHVLGILVFIALVGGYYLLYHQDNSLANVFTTLFSESSKRTAVNYGFGATLLHLLTFPFEMIYHFLPWTIFVIYLFKKGVFKTIFQNEFVVYCFFIFLVNILVYWSSVEVYPRYLLMFPPLVFGPLFYLYFECGKKCWQYRAIHIVFMVLIAGITLGSFALFFLERLNGIPYLTLKATVVSIMLVLTAYWFFKRESDRLLIVVVFLLIFRIGFDMFVLPDRNANDFGDAVRDTSVELGRMSEGQELFVFCNTNMQPANVFYITNERRALLTRKCEDLDLEALYIVQPDCLPGNVILKLSEIKVRHWEPKFRDVVRLNSVPEKKECIDFK